MKRRPLLILSLALLAFSMNAAKATPDVVRTSTYQLDSGQFVRRWLDEPMQLLCLAVQSGQSGATQAITCVPMAVTAYGLPATELP